MCALCSSGGEPDYDHFGRHFGGCKLVQSRAANVPLLELLEALRSTQEHMLAHRVHRLWEQASLAPIKWYIFAIAICFGGFVFSAIIQCFIFLCAAPVRMFCFCSCRFHPAPILQIYRCANARDKAISIGFVTGIRHRLGHLPSYIRHEQHGCDCICRSMSSEGPFAGAYAQA